MKIEKTASGKQGLKITQAEWEAIGKKAGWLKTAATEGYKTKLQPYKTSPTDPFGEMGGPISPQASEEWSVNFPRFDGPTPLITGKGATPEAAVEDLKRKSQENQVALAWFDEIDWVDFPRSP